jgi:hypothetical protein
MVMPRSLDCEATFDHVERRRPVDTIEWRRSSLWLPNWHVSTLFDESRLCLAPAIPTALAAPEIVEADAANARRP